MHVCVYMYDWPERRGWSGSRGGGRGGGGGEGGGGGRGVRRRELVKSGGNKVVEFVSGILIWV